MLKRGNKKRDKLFSLSLLILCTPAEYRRIAENQLVTRIFDTYWNAVSRLLDAIILKRPEEVHLYALLKGNFYHQRWIDCNLFRCKSTTFF